MDAQEGSDNDHKVALPATMVRNHLPPKFQGTILKTDGNVMDFIRSGLLVRLDGNRNYELADVSFPYVRPQVKLFVERLSAQSRAKCEDSIVLTSGTRSLAGQPSNGSSRSVHPAGMAVDLRIHAPRLRANQVGDRSRAGRQPARERAR